MTDLESGSEKSKYNWFKLILAAAVVLAALTMPVLFRIKMRQESFMGENVLDDLKKGVTAQILGFVPIILFQILIFVILLVCIISALRRGDRSKLWRLIAAAVIFVFYSITLFDRGKGQFADYSIDDSEMNIFSKIALYENISADIESGETEEIVSERAYVRQGSVSVKTRRRSSSRYYFYLQCGEKRFILSFSDAEAVSKLIVENYGSDISVMYFKNSGIIKNISFDENYEIENGS